jgi:hypothetical protein
MGTVLTVLRVPKVPRVLEVPRLLLLVILTACSGLSVKIGVYQTLDEARSAGAIGSGWVPEGLPASANDLREGHMPNGPQHWGAFSFKSEDAAAVRALLGNEITSGTLTCDPPGRLEFWPRLLLSPVDVERVKTTGFRLYQGSGGRTYAINWGQARVYYWKE